MIEKLPELESLGDMHWELALKMVSTEIVENREKINEVIEHLEGNAPTTQLEGQRNMLQELWVEAGLSGEYSHNAMIERIEELVEAKFMYEGLCE